VRTQNVPADAVTSVVVNLTEDEREFLLQKVTHSISVARSNMQDRSLPEKDHEYYINQYQMAVRLLTKLGA
jgi:hypothetical protein